MGNVVRLSQAPARRSGAKVLLAVGLGAWGMLFASLLFSLAFVRAQASIWPPPDGSRLEPRALALAGALLLLAAAAAWFARARAGRGTLALLWLLAAVLVVGAVAVEGQVFLEARRLSAGQKGAFGGAYRTWLLLHALHTGLALPGLVTMAARALKGHYQVPGPVAAGAWAWSAYLAFSFAAWALMFALVHL